MILTALAAGAVVLLSVGVGWLIGRPTKKQQKRKSVNTLATITVAALSKGYVVDASGDVFRLWMQNKRTGYDMDRTVVFSITMDELDYDELFMAMEQLPDAETWIKTSGSKGSW